LEEFPFVHCPLWPGCSGQAVYYLFSVAVATIEVYELQHFTVSTQAELALGHHHPEALNLSRDTQQLHAVP
jgi:hypothetical protein